jgi:hypothetical protein
MVVKLICDFGMRVEMRYEVGRERLRDLLVE